MLKGGRSGLGGGRRISNGFVAAAAGGRRRQDRGRVMVADRELDVTVLRTRRPCAGVRESRDHGKSFAGATGNVRYLLDSSSRVIADNGHAAAGMVGLVESAGTSDSKGERFEVCFLLHPRPGASR